RSNGLTVNKRAFRALALAKRATAHRQQTVFHGAPKDSPPSPTYQSGTPVASSLEMDGPTPLPTKGPYHASCSGFAVGVRREPGRSGGGVAHSEGQKSAPPGHAQPSGEHHH